MADYAVVSIQGKQYQIKNGDKITVDRLSDTPQGQSIQTTEVLLRRTGDQVQVGSPFITDAKVSLQVVSHVKGKKIDIRKYKAKSRYRRHIGFRPYQSVLEVTSLGTDQPTREKITTKSTPSRRKAATTSK